MLCRVADSLFWISRYIERAENTVRFVDVTLQTQLESEQTTDELSYELWAPLLSSLGDRALFESLYDTHDSTNVTDFLTFNSDNPSSVYSCIAAARENARMVRDQISGEMWSVINRLYLYIRKQDREAICRDIRFEFFEYVKEHSLLFQGVTDSTFSHQIGFEFMQCGKFIERADKTSRILDSKQYMRSEGILDDAFDAAQWAAMLKGCSAAEAFYQNYITGVSGDLVLHFLLLDHTFPRSVIYCIQRLQLAIHAISGCPVTHYTSEAERKVGMLLSQLNYSQPSDLKDGKSTKLIDHIKMILEVIAVELSEQYMFFEIVDPASEIEQ